MYNFDKIADRSKDHSRKWCPLFNKNVYGEIPEDYIAMSIADMDFELAPSIVNKLQLMLDTKTCGYTYAHEDLLKSIQQWNAKKTGRTIPNEAILPFNGVVPSLNLICQTFTEIGDRMIILSPVYGPFRQVAKNNQLSVIECDLEINALGKYEINFDAFEDNVKKHHPKIFIFCNPQNPSGKVWSKKDVEKLAKICMDNHVLFVSDEVHSDHIYEGEFTSALSLDEVYLSNTIVANGPNKGFNFAGLASSYLIILDEKLREKMVTSMEENVVLPPNAFAMAAISAAYSEDGRKWLEECYDYIIQSYLWIQKFIESEMSLIKSMPIEASYLLWLDVSQLNVTGDIFTHRLAKEEGVLVQKGSDFGEAGENFVRINIGTSFSMNKKAFYRIKKLYEKILKEKS